MIYAIIRICRHCQIIYLVNSNVLNNSEHELLRDGLDRPWNVQIIGNAYMRACLTNNDLYHILNFQCPNFKITQHFS